MPNLSFKINENDSVIIVTQGTKEQIKTTKQNDHRVGRADCKPNKIVQQRTEGNCLNLMARNSWKPYSTME